jgi:ATP-dependent DNA helicase RecG
VIVPIGDLLQQLNSLGEDARIEAKAARQSGPSILETICAFANEPNLGGGYLLLGVVYDDSADEYVVEGVANPEKVQADVASQCASAFNRPLRPILWTEEVEAKPVIGIFVPESQPQEKPLYFRNQGLPRGAFRRIGTTDQRCTEDDLLVFYQDQRHGTYDETLILAAGVDDLDPEAISAYRRYRAEADPNAEELSWTDTELLQSLACVGSEAGRLVPTVAGLLLFGTTRALRRHFPMMRVDYIRVPGRTWVSNPDRRFDTIEMRGPLIQLIGRIRATILGDLPAAFSLPAGRVQRLEVPAIPDRVIREVVVNAVMHRSYRIHGAVQIIRYANRLEIRNPGHSLVADDQLGEPGSKTRNPTIAAVLHETRFAETKGSGIRVMRTMMSEANLSPPAFESNRGRDEFVATLLMHHFLDAEDMAWLAQFQQHNLSGSEASALIFVRETGAIGNAPYRHLTGVDALTARRDLRRLRDIGLLEQKGKGFDTYYAATTALLSPEHAASSGSSPNEGSAIAVGVAPVQIPLPTVQTPGLEALSPGSGSLSPGLQPLSPGLEGIPGELAARLTELGERADPKVVREAIRELCSWRELRPAEIAAALGRTQDYVQRNYLRPMLRDGEIAMTIPERPAHPNQAYRAVPREADR